jgi:hypothetical protein
MADADLDVVIRQLAKQQNKSLMAALKGRRDRYLGMAAKAKDSDTKARYKQMAQDTMLHGNSAAKRLQMSADNAADSYARSLRMAAEEAFAKKAAAADKPAPAKKAPTKKPAAPKKAASAKKAKKTKKTKA